MGFPRSWRLPGVLIGAFWLAAHVLSLTHFPPMHADEAWLASETRPVLAARPPAADFFHLTQRPVHAIRMLFHGLQAPLVAAAWSLASVRLLSLICGAAVVLLAADLAGKLFDSPAARLLFVGGLAFDPQMVVSSHLARPEIVLVLALMGALVVRVRRPLAGLGNEVLAGSLLGLAIGVHANSLLVALALGVLYLLDALAGPDRGPALRRLLVLVAVVAAWALVWIGWSRLLDPGFPGAYAEFGRRYGVGESLPVKILRLPAFYRRLFARIPGTYYLPDLRPVLLLFAGASAAGLLMRRPGRRGWIGVAEPLVMLLAVNVGLVAIGKYSQPTAVLLMPAGYWLVSAVLEGLSGAGGGRGRVGDGRDGGRGEGGGVGWSGGGRGVGRDGYGGGGGGDGGDGRGGGWGRTAALLAAALVVGGLGVWTVRLAVPWMPVSYGRYLERIRAHVPAEARVLGGPNTAFAFEPGALHAFNDLDALKASGLTFREYIERFGIQYILYPDELDRIYAERPIWNDLYGNPAPYYGEMKRFLAERCRVLAVYDEPVFAMRPVAYQGRVPARLTVYRVLPPER